MSRFFIADVSPISELSHGSLIREIRFIRSFTVPAVLRNQQRRSSVNLETKDEPPGIGSFIIDQVDDRMEGRFGLAVAVEQQGFSPRTP